MVNAVCARFTSTFVWFRPVCRLNGRLGLTLIHVEREPRNRWFPCGQGIATSVRTVGRADTILAREQTALGANALEGKRMTAELGVVSDVVCGLI